MTEPRQRPALATELLRLHRDEALLTVVNVWDAISAKVVAETAGTTALATASHSIAATLGYPDGEHIPREEMLAMVARIVAASELPVSADLEAGYGDAADTIRAAIDVGVVGANIEDQLTPMAEAARKVEQVMAAAGGAGVPDFVLNARTDVYLQAGDRSQAELYTDALARSRAFLDAGAPVVFVPRLSDEQRIEDLVGEIGRQRLTLIGMPGLPSLTRLEELGVARVSYGPHSQRVALTALQRLVEDVAAGGGLPDDVRPLN